MPGGCYAIVFFDSIAYIQGMTRMTFALLFITGIAYGQTQEQKDSLINVMCETFVSTENLPDTSRIGYTFESHMMDFLSQYPQSQRQELLNGLFIRFQRNCPPFKAFLDRMDPPSGDWKTVDGKPLTRLNKRECRQFLNHRNFAYLESSGDTVKLEIANGFWIDHFKDGTFSKLKLEWISDCEFEIEFVESNNDVRKNFSKPGDRYVYQIVDKKPEFYDMSVEIKGTGRYALFRMYY